MAKLVAFPKRARKFKAGNSTPEELATATQVQGIFMPIVREKPSVELVKIADEMRAFNAYAKLRPERMKRRHVGTRMKRRHVGTRMKRVAEAEKRSSEL